MSLTDSRNYVTVPISWRGKTGEQFWISFKERIALRTPEATSLARASAFNRITLNVGKLYGNRG